MVGDIAWLKNHFMSYHKLYRRLRVKSVQMFDALYGEPGNRKKCSKAVWKRTGCFIFGISDRTYYRYLKEDVSDVPSLPSEAIDQLRHFIDHLLESERRAGRTGHPQAGCGMEKGEHENEYSFGSVKRA